MSVLSFDRFHVVCLQLLESQAAYHRRALQAIEEVIPKMKTTIGKTKFAAFASLSVHSCHHLNTGDCIVLYYDGENLLIHG